MERFWASGLLIRRSLVRAQVEEPRQASRKANPSGLAFLLSGRLLVRGFRCRARDHASWRGHSDTPVRCVEMTPPAARHATRRAPRPLRHDCHPSGHMPPPAATVSPSRDTGTHSLFNALPSSRPARTGPPADSERPIALGVNFDKGVYVVLQLTPPSAQRPPTQNSLADPSRVMQNYLVPS